MHAHKHSTIGQHDCNSCPGSGFTYTHYRGYYKHAADTANASRTSARTTCNMPCKLKPPQRRAELCQQPSPVHVRTPLDDHFDRVQTRPVHARESREIVERSGYDG